MPEKFPQPEEKMMPSAEQGEVVETVEWRGKSQLRARAEKFFKALALSAALLSGARQEAEAGELKEEVPIQFEIVELKNAEFSDGRVSYGQVKSDTESFKETAFNILMRIRPTAMGEKEIIGKETTNKDILVIERLFRQEPTEKTVEETIKRYPDIAKETGEIEKIKRAQWSLKAEFPEDFPKLVEEKMLADLVDPSYLGSVGVTEGDLCQLYAEAKAVNALRALEKGDSPEARVLIDSLQTRIRQMQNQYRVLTGKDSPFSDAFLSEVFGNKTE